MVDLARRLWSIFIPGFIACVLGIVQSLIWLDGKWYQNLVSISLGFLALICLILGGITLFYDVRDTLRKEKKAKEPSVYEKGGLRII
jgi:hypothetical protein